MDKRYKNEREAQHLSELLWKVMKENNFDDKSFAIIATPELASVIDDRFYCPACQYTMERDGNYNFDCAGCPLFLSHNDKCESTKGPFHAWLASEDEDELRRNAMIVLDYCVEWGKRLDAANEKGENNE